MDALVRVVELRALLVADCAISLSHRQRLVCSITSLVGDPSKREKLANEMVLLLEMRFGRNPDTFQISSATLKLLHVLDDVQSGAYTRTK